MSNLPERKTQTNQHSENQHFRMLGYDSDESSKLVYYFFGHSAKSVIKLSPSGMSKANILMLAPLDYWETLSGGKVNIDMVQRFLIENSHKIGIFREKLIRGRGAWIDDRRLIIHTGSSIMVDGTRIHLRDFQSKYVYQIGEELNFSIENPLTKFEASKLINKVKWLNWEREIDAYILLGWCLIAPFCGVLDWRPHIWLTGPAGSGKSWTLRHMMKRLMNGIFLGVQGKTTEPGIRGTLQCDAIPVVFDESDVDTQGDKDRIQAILALARSSSSNDGGLVVKGNQTGGAIPYTVRSCFAFTSIGVQTNGQADKSRSTIISLKAIEGEKEDMDEKFESFTKDWEDLATDEFTKRLQARTLQLLPTILKNSKVFTLAASKIVDRRFGDQVGSMLAAAYSLTNDDVVDFKIACDWVASKDWSEEKGLELTKDENQLFSLIMGREIEVESQFGNIKKTIGEWLLVASNTETVIGVPADTVDKRLRRIGLMVVDNKIYISNTANGIKNIIKDSSWSNNHNKVLERINGAERTESRKYYPGLNSRGISIPISILLEKN